MSNVNKENKIGFLLLGLSLAMGMIISAFIVSLTIERVKLANEKITVKGFAEKRITSDIAVWKSKVIVRSSNIKAAYEKLEQNLGKVIFYFEKQGIKKEKLDIFSVSTLTRHKYNEKGYLTNEISGYVLEQIIEINSDNVQLISRLSKESTSLIKEGVEFISLVPRYYYSKFDEIKIQLIGEATKNAKLRADQFAENSGLKVGNLKSATQGVFQVTPVNSTEISGYGRYDTTTIEKSVKAVVTIDYSIRKSLKE